ncbi:hypothetical protein [Streptomyces sp. NPDC058371]|uniref:hypothetical protein n=1 Tax=Streptomyces sp. NPDC058371 TaxID=3346463 RepID=UPI0036653104
MLAELGDRHRSLRGMRAEYLDFFAGVIALSCIRMNAVLGTGLETRECRRYWRYMRHSLALLGAELGDQAEVSDSCAHFVSCHTGAGPRTKTYLAQLFDAYPEHMLACSKALFPETRRVVAHTLGLGPALPSGWSAA